MHVFFRLQGGIWILPALTPGIWWLDCRHRASVFLLQMIFMETRHCPVHLVEFDDHTCINWPEYFEMNRWTGKEDEFHELVGLLEFLFVPSMTGVSKWSVLEMHPPIELHRHRGKTPNNGQFLITSYTSLYIILDTYLYSKAPSPGVNYFGCHRTCFSC